MTDKINKKELAESVRQFVGGGDPPSRHAKIPHATIRALERYGLKLTHGDLDNLAMECAKGYGRLRFLPKGRERHLVACHGKGVVVIYAPPGVHDPTHDHPKPNPHGTIITVLPPEAATNKNKESFQRRRLIRLKKPQAKIPKKARRW